MPQGSLSNLLSTVYPEQDWLPWKFDERTDNFWQDKKIQRKFVDWAAKQLEIKEMSDWYKVTQKVIFVNFQVEILPRNLLILEVPAS
jgi:hypothetical protein